MEYLSIFFKEKNVYWRFFFLFKEWKLTIFAAVSVSASRTALTTPRYSRRTAADRFLDDFLDNCIRLPPRNSISLCVIYRRVTALSTSNRELSGGGFGWSVETGSGRSLLGGHRGAAYVQNVKELENWLLLSFFCFPLRSETRQVRMLREAVRSGWLRVKGSLLVGQISWMFWEAAAGGRVRRPFPPDRARKREWERGWCGTDWLQSLWWPQWKQAAPGASPQRRCSKYDSRAEEHSLPSG